jgi:hypothetical protein
MQQDAEPKNKKKVYTLIWRGSLFSLHTPELLVAIGNKIVQDLENNPNFSYSMTDIFIKKYCYMELKYKV